LASTSVSKHGGAAAFRSAVARKHLAKTAAVAALVCAISTACVFRRPWFYGNLGVVDPGRVIRSAQPTTQLDRWARDFQLHSILNLRGGGPADWWYEAEVHRALEHGLSYFDLPLSATRRPTRRQLLTLIDLLERCPYPLLIHCKSGADRTGLASALYLMVRRGEPPERALGAFSIEYGHIPLFGTEQLHEPLLEYAAWLKSNQLTHTPVRFRAWVRNDYHADDPHVDPPLLQPGPRVRRQ
jgi:hypothetical protein